MDFLGEWKPVELTDEDREMMEYAYIEEEARRYEEEKYNAEMEIDSYQSPQELQQAKDWYDEHKK
jgi:hypothetical protein